MKHLRLTLITFIALSAVTALGLILKPSKAVDQRGSSVREKALAAYGQLPLSFEANHGQFDPAIKFASRGHGYSLFLKSDEAKLTVAEPSASPVSVKMRLVNSNAQAQMEGLEELPGKAHYLVGDDPRQWRRDITTFAKTHYRDVYPGVDLVFYGDHQKLEYDFIVAPKADHHVIKLRFDDVQNVRIDDHGDLLLQTPTGEMRQRKPIVYQEDDAGSAYNGGTTRSLDFPATSGAYKSPIQGNGDSFVAKLNPSGTAIVYSAILGGSGSEGVHGLAIDRSGNAYLASLTNSPDLPVTPGALRTTVDGAFIAKLNATGTALDYSTYINFGASNNYSSLSLDLGVDASGHAYVAGLNRSSFSSPNANTLTPGYVWKLNPQGTALLYTREFSNTDLNAIAVDSDGNAYLTGMTTSTSFPVTANAFQSQMQGGVCGSYIPFPWCHAPPPFCPPTPTPTPVNIPCTDGFVAKLNPSGASVYSSFLGGSSTDSGHRIVIDGAGNAYVYGVTASRNFPLTPGAYQIAITGNQPFLAKISADDRRSPATSVSAASYAGSPLAPESIVAAFGDHLATTTAPAPSIPLPTDLGGTMVGWV